MGLQKNSILPNITGFKLKVKNKIEAEKYSCMKKNTLDKFNKKWLINKQLVVYQAPVVRRLDNTIY